jgi:DNA-binding GntR family transcriptional regulator
LALAIVVDKLYTSANHERQSRAPKKEVQSMATKRGSGAQTVYAALKHDILDLSLPPGAALDETTLAARFGLSRTPIREALVKLVAEGLATSLPNRNTVVTAIDFLAVPACLDALMLLYRVTTRLAATRHTAADLAAIRAEQQHFAQAVAAADAIGMIETNKAFHLAIARAGGNPYYTDLFTRVLNDSSRLLRVYYRTFGDHLPAEYVDEHEALITAIAARDADLADRLASEHAAQIIGRIQDFMQPTMASGIALRG